MSPRFSQQQLFALRNQIPIELLIEKVLAVPSDRKNGYLRFACPLCQGFHTGVNAEHNLARCFDCRKNFNPIDMVMCRNKTSFKQSVDFLKKYYPQLFEANPNRPCRLSPESNAQPAQISAHTGERTNNAVPIAQVLSQLQPSAQSEPQMPDYLIDHKDLFKRIRILEQKVDMLISLSKSLG